MDVLEGSMEKRDAMKMSQMTKPKTKKRAMAAVIEKNQYYYRRNKMNKIYLMILLLGLLFVPYTYAQMGGGIMGGQETQEQKGSTMMGGQQGHMNRSGMMSKDHMEGMLQGHEVRGGMMHNMGQMSRLMQQMRDMMASKPGAEHMRKISDLMLEMSEHIEEMSKIMKKGTVTEKEMQMLDQHNRKMQESYDMMRW
jgi:hypothetical protein